MSAVKTIQKSSKPPSLDKVISLLKSMYKKQTSLQYLPKIIQMFESGALPHNFHAYELIACINRNQTQKLALFKKYATYAYFLDTTLQPPLDPGLDLSVVPSELSECHVRPPVTENENDVQPVVVQQQVEKQDFIQADNIDHHAQFESIWKSSDPIYQLLLSDTAKPQYHVDHHVTDLYLTASCTLFLEASSISLPAFRIPRKTALKARVKLTKKDTVEEGGLMYKRAINRVVAECVKFLTDIRRDIFRAVDDRLSHGLEGKLNRWRLQVFAENCKKAYQRVKHVVLHDDHAALIGANVLMFGSANVGMVMNDSDVDFTIVLPKGERQVKSETREREKDMHVAVLMYLEKKMDNFGMEQAYVVDTARIPLLRYRDPEAGIDVDVSISDGRGVLLSRFIRRHLQTDVRIWELCMLVKFWAKQRAICGTPEGFINPIGWTIMAIFFLQHGVHPSIAQLLRVKEKADNVALISKVPWKSKMSSAPSRQNTASLLSAFFRFYSSEFDFSDTAVSLNCQDLYQAKQLRESRKSDTVFIEQPLHFGVNVVPHVANGAIKLTRQELQRAYLLCATNGDAAKLFAARDDLEATPELGLA